MQRNKTFVLLVPRNANVPRCTQFFRNISKSTKKYNKPAWKAGLSPYPEKFEFCTHFCLGHVFKAKYHLKILKIKKFQENQKVPKIALLTKHKKYAWVQIGYIDNGFIKQKIINVPMYPEK